MARSIEERRKALEQKMAQLKAEDQRLKAQARRETKRQDDGRKVALGALLIHMAQKNDRHADMIEELIGMMDPKTRTRFDGWPIPRPAANGGPSAPGPASADRKLESASKSHGASSPDSASASRPALRG